MTDSGIISQPVLQYFEGLRYLEMKVEGKVSNDPMFEEKATEIVGLHFDSPD